MRTYRLEILFYVGKDSMEFHQNINFAQYGDIGKLVYKCLVSFCAGEIIAVDLHFPLRFEYMNIGKSSSDDVFETLTPPVLNKHLNSLMDGLTAKVFRTYNASITLETQLPTPETLKDMSIQENVMLFNAANRQVAILCNHQKTVSKAAETMFGNLNEKLDTLRKQANDMIT